jgi:hypothetical protein
MLLLQSLQTQNHAILTRLDSMDDTNKQRHGELCAEITSKADSTDITCLDHQLADVNNQLSSAVVDIKANLTHVTKTHAAELKKLDEMIVTQHACLDSYSTSLDDRFAALERRLSSPHSTRRTTVVDPSLRGCNSSTSKFPSAVLPEGSVDNTPGPDDSADANDDDVDIDGTVPMPRNPHRTVIHNTTQGIPRGRMDPTGVLPEENTFTLPSGHFGSGLGGPTIPIATPRRDEQGANAHATHMAGPAGAHLRASLPPTPPRKKLPGRRKSHLLHTPHHHPLRIQLWFVRHRPVPVVHSYHHGKTRNAQKGLTGLILRGWPTNHTMGRRTVSTHSLWGFWQTAASTWCLWTTLLVVSTKSLPSTIESRIPGPTLPTTPLDPRSIGSSSSHSNSFLP